jgi:hypothetical protein
MFSLGNIFLSLVIAFVHSGGTQSRKSSSAGLHRHERANKSIAVDIPEFSMNEVSLEPAKKDNLVISKNKKYEAFTVEGTRLFVLERRTRRLLQITGLPLEWRPFSDLTWADNQTLMFDRWSEPHYGVHYKVNVLSRKLLVVAPFAD